MTPRSKIVVAAVLFSTGGAAIKWCGFDGWQLAAFRAGIALVGGVLILGATGLRSLADARAPAPL